VPDVSVSKHAHVAFVWQPDAQASTSRFPVNIRLPPWLVEQKVFRFGPSNPGIVGSDGGGGGGGEGGGGGDGGGAGDGGGTGGGPVPFAAL
jgi:hypothetical protein